MKDNEKKVKATEDVKEEVKTEEQGVELTDVQLKKVSGGKENAVKPETEDARKFWAELADLK